MRHTRIYTSPYTPYQNTGVRVLNGRDKNRRTTHVRKTHSLYLPFRFKRTIHVCCLFVTTVRVCIKNRLRRIAQTKSINGVRYHNKTFMFHIELRLEK